MFRRKLLLLIISGTLPYENGRPIRRLPVKGNLFNTLLRINLNIYYVLSFTANWFKSTNTCVMCVTGFSCDTTNPLLQCSGRCKEWVHSSCANVSDAFCCDGCSFADADTDPKKCELCFKYGGCLMNYEGFLCHPICWASNDSAISNAEFAANHNADEFECYRCKHSTGKMLQCTAANCSGELYHAYCALTHPLPTRVNDVPPVLCMIKDTARIKKFHLRLYCKLHADTLVDNYNCEREIWCVPSFPEIDRRTKARSTQGGGQRIIFNNTSGMSALKVIVLHTFTTICITLFHSAAPTIFETEADESDASAGGSDTNSHDIDENSDAFIDNSSQISIYSEVNYHAVDSKFANADSAGRNHKENERSMGLTSKFKVDHPYIGYSKLKHYFPAYQYLMFPLINNYSVCFPLISTFTILSAAKGCRLAYTK